MQQEYQALKPGGGRCDGLGFGLDGGVDRGGDLGGNRGALAFEALAEALNFGEDLLVDPVDAFQLGSVFGVEVGEAALDLRGIVAQAGVDGLPNNVKYVLIQDGGIAGGDGWSAGQGLDAPLDLRDAVCKGRLAAHFASSGTRRPLGEFHEQMFWEWKGNRQRERNSINHL